MLLPQDTGYKAMADSIDLSLLKPIRWPRVRRPELIAILVVRVVGRRPSLDHPICFRAPSGAVHADAATVLCTDSQILALVDWQQTVAKNTLDLECIPAPVLRTEAAS